MKEIKISTIDIIAKSGQQIQKNIFEVLLEKYLKSKKFKRNMEKNKHFKIKWRICKSKYKNILDVKFSSR